MKKKKTEIPVTLSREELIPSVIGVIEIKNKNNISIFIFFVLLILFVFALPSINSFFNAEQKENQPNNEGNKPLPEPEEPVEEAVIYPITSNLKIFVDQMLFHDFVLTNDSISIQITNNGEAKNYLSKHQLYLELYSKDKTLLQRIKITNDSISKSTTTPYVYDLLPEVYSSSTNIILDEKTVDDYPNIQLNKDKDDNLFLKAKNEYHQLTYLFNKDQQLFYITDLFHYSKNETDYLIMLEESKQQTSLYNGIEGVYASLLENDTGFTLTTTLDLEQIDLSDNEIKSKFKNQFYYGKNTEAKAVYFELSAMNYQCSM